MVIEIPAGLIAPPSGMQGFWYWFLDNRRFAIGGLGFVGVLGFYLARLDMRSAAIRPRAPSSRFSIRRRASRRRSPATSGTGAGAAAAGAISPPRSCRSRSRGCSSSTIRAKTSSSPAPRRRARSGGEPLPPGERAIFGWVERKSGEVAIDKANGASLASTFATFKSTIENENRNRFFKRNLGYFTMGLLLTALAIILVFIFGDLSQGEIGLLVAFAVGGFFLGMFIVPILRSIFGARGVKSVVTIGLNLAILGFIVVTFWSLVSSGLSALPSDFGTSVWRGFLSNSFPFLLVGGFTLLNGLFYYLLRAPTAAGRGVMDEIEGLELYIRTAETNRLNLAGAPDLDSTQFERLLPYAIALDAEEALVGRLPVGLCPGSPGRGVRRRLPAHLAWRLWLERAELRQLDLLGGVVRPGLVPELGAGAEIVLLRLRRGRRRRRIGWRRRRWWRRRLVGRRASAGRPPLRQQHGAGESPGPLPITEAARTGLSREADTLTSCRRKPASITAGQSGESSSLSGCLRWAPAFKCVKESPARYGRMTLHRCHLLAVILRLDRRIGLGGAISLDDSATSIDPPVKPEDDGIDCFPGGAVLCRCRSQFLHTLFRRGDEIPSPAQSKTELGLDEPDPDC